MLYAARINGAEYKQETRVTMWPGMISQIAICRTSRWELFNEHFDRDGGANDFSILMERNDSLFNDRDECALFASMNFTGDGRKRGVDLTIRVKLAATRHFSYAAIVFMRQ